MVFRVSCAGRTGYVHPLSRGGWGLVTTYSWASNSTCSWGATYIKPFRETISRVRGPVISHRAGGMNLDSGVRIAWGCSTLYPNKAWLRSIWALFWDGGGIEEVPYNSMICYTSLPMCQLTHSARSRQSFCSGVCWGR